MKITKCYVSSFGALKDRVFDFVDGLNCFKEDNGYGKSTLTVFIKSMFYGLDDSKRSIADNERTKFKPWYSTEKFGGYIEFIWQDKNYKIERYFGVKESEDSCILTDIATGKQYENQVDLGKRIFSIDQEGFFSTTYLSQKDFEIKSNSSITSKYNSIFGENEGVETYDLAIKKLDDSIKKLKKVGDKGLIADKNREFFAVQERLENAKNMQNQATALKNDINLLQIEVDKLKNESQIISQKIVVASKIEADKTIRARIKELEAQIKELNSKKDVLENTFNAGVPTDENIASYKELYKDLNNFNAQESLYLSKLEQEKQNTNQSKQKIKFPVIYLFLFVVLAIAGGVSFLFNFYAGISLTALSVIFLFVTILGFLYSKNNQKSNNKDNLENLQNQYKEFLTIKEESKKKLDGFFAQYGIFDSDYINCFTILSKTKNDYDNILDNLSNLNDQLKNLLGQVDNSTQEFSESLSELNQKQRDLQTEFIEKSELLARKNSALEKANEIIDNIFDLESYGQELKEEIQNLKEKLQIYSLTKKYLASADENLKVRYRKPLEDSLNKYYSLITNDKDRSVTIDIDLKISVIDNGSSKDTAYYSKGYRNLFEICKRFALTDVLFTGEKPFIILDDPFTNLDDGKLNEALDLIKKLSTEYQILYFVCHQSRSV